MPTDPSYLRPTAVLPGRTAQARVFSGAFSIPSYRPTCSRAHAHRRAGGRARTRGFSVGRGRTVGRMDQFTGKGKERVNKPMGESA